MACAGGRIERAAASPRLAWLALCCIGVVCSLPARAASGVTLWGAVDAGVTYVNNQVGGHSYAMDNGIAMPNLFGMRGVEELGGGNRAVFELIDQFNLGTGTTFPTNGGGIFGRNAYVGLQSDRYGKLTFGEQYDFMIDSLLRFDNSISIAGLYGFRQGPFAGLGIPGNVSGSANFDRMSGTAISNSVKYVTPTVAGFSGGALYSFGGVPGSLARGDGNSVGLNYAAGPLAVGAAYTYQRYAALDRGYAGIRNFGAGVDYKLERLAIDFLYTNTRNTANGAAINVLQVGARYQLTPAFSFGGAYQLMKGNATLAEDQAHQLSAGARYALSKSTVAYLEVVYQKVSGDDDPKAWIMAVPKASGNDRQLLTRIGILHRF
ncbi:porin [Chitinasiproducens palmae]|uniref:porin n=1 Tax=Chitinasiproducens palmae TaxID=1770053 RepID=UPI000A903383|nr:porin [Chitinasiproducens palmae]